MALNPEHIKWFRDSSPYIDAHRGRTFVLCLAGNALRSENLANILTDIALLRSLGVYLVVCVGTDETIDETCASSGEPWELVAGHRVTTAANMNVITAEMGRILSDLAARFSASTTDSPTGRQDIFTATGNYVKARPLGIIDGTDLHHTGGVRKIHHGLIRAHLDSGAIVLIPGVGYSPSGETFHISADVIAMETACALRADKLIYFVEGTGLADSDGELISEIDLSHPERSVPDDRFGAQQLLDHAGRACRSGVDRCHVISFASDGALLEELFTRDGCGTQITGHSYEQVRAATIDDVPGILRLIEPLESSGVLVKRSRELLESEIDRFIVIERDGLLISCAALYTFDNAGELACLVTHPDYRNGDRGDRLLEVIERTARQQQLTELFVLTTQSEHWFAERGFRKADIQTLPAPKKSLYNYQRNSTILKKALYNDRNLSH